MEIQKGRNPSLDLLRCIALFCVILVHFFAHTGFYNVEVAGAGMYIMTLIRTAAMVCCPLFMMLSGYLMNKKALTARYYMGLLKTLGIYLLASLFCAVSLILFNLLIEKSPVSLFSLLAGIFSYSTAPYAWYVEMYIGLFCLIPFLNILYHGLEGKQQKQWLLLVLLLMTSLPGMLNTFKLSDIRWWLTPSSSDSYHQLIPSWWTGIYPITYYYLGCYLRDYPIRLKKGTHIGLYILSVMLAGAYNFYRSSGSTFVWGAWQEQGSLINVVQSVLLFTLVARLDLTRLSKTSQAWLSRLSGWCLGAYLVSWVFDKFFYKILEKLCPSIHQRFPWLLLMVPVIFCCSLVVSAVINQIYSVFSTWLAKLRPDRSAV